MSSALGGCLEQLAYELSTRSLQQQEAALSELRSRTGVLLAAAALVASFLGARAIDAGGLSLWNGAGLVALVVAILLSAYILAPRKRMRFALSGAQTYEYFAQEQTDLAEAYRTLAYWLDGAWEQNQVLGDPLVKCFTGACIALAVEVVAWSAQLAGTLS